MIRKPRTLETAASLVIAMVAGVLIPTVSLADPVTTFGDIQSWVGTGNNQAALVIDWDNNSSSDPALVWGYRWDGTATGSDMLEAIVSADDRLFAKLNHLPGSSTLVYGLGYDATDDGQFAIDDGTAFDASGFAVSGPSNGAMSNDLSDYYAEGWDENRAWYYGISTSNLSPFDGGGWTGGPGISSRDLVHGDWDSWAIASLIPSPDFIVPTYSENPVAAEPRAADFDLDGDVDGADFLIWQRGFGILSGATLAQGDATGEGAVDDFDLNQWASQFGSSAATTATTFAVPEPSSTQLIGMFLFFVFLKRRKV